MDKRDITTALVKAVIVTVVGRVVKNAVLARGASTKLSELTGVVGGALVVYAADDYVNNTVDGFYTSREAQSA